jgi:hypothetical protein
MSEKRVLKKEKEFLQSNFLKNAREIKSKQTFDLNTGD